VCCLHPGQVAPTACCLPRCCFGRPAWRLASCRDGQDACLFVRGARAHVCMAAEWWPKFFHHSMASSSVYFMRFRCIFYLDIVYVAMATHVCCNGYTPMLQYISNVLAISNVCCKCFIWMLHMLQWPYTYMLQVYILNVSSISDVCCKYFIWMFHMFRWLYTYVASLYSKCFICFRHMLQVCLSGCCSCYTHMLQTYVCKCLTCFRRILHKCFMLQH